MQNLDAMSNLSDEQLVNMVNSMKANPQLLRNQYEMMNGMKMSDEQFNQILANLSPDTIRMSMNMAKNNPEMIRKAQEMKERQQRAQN